MIEILPHHLDVVRRILAEVVPDAEVSVFGSRATLSAKEHSDLDLAINGKAAIDKTVLRRLAVAFEESELPYRVDVVDYATVSDEFRKIIDRHAVKVGGLADSNAFTPPKSPEGGLLRR